MTPPRTFACRCGETITEAPGHPFVAPPTHTHPNRRTYVMTEVDPDKETR